MGSLFSTGGSNKATDAAGAAEAQREAQQKATDAAINAAYDSPQRQKEIGDYVDAMRTFYGDDLSRQKTINDNQLKFSLARNGQIGGSTQIDQSAKLGQDYARGLLTVEQQAQGAGANLRSQDQQSKANLESLANQGLDATTASQDAALAESSALQSSKSAAMAQGVGNQFGDLTDFYTQSQTQAGQNSINNPFSAGQFSSNFQPAPYIAPTGGSSANQTPSSPWGY